MMKRFKKQSDLIKHAVRMTYRRKADKAKEDRKKFMDKLRIKNFLKWAELKLRLPR